MIKKSLLLTLSVLAFALLAGCGDDGGSSSSESSSEEAAMERDASAESENAAMEEDAEAMEEENAAMEEDGEAMEEEAAAMESEPGTEIVARDSEFGTVLVDSEDQAIYIFENDGPGQSNCNGACAAAWPPVPAKAAPKAGDGVDASLLGTTQRADGSKQVTYAGQPLYYYAHEAPGEIRCHNVDLNGGFWWVIGPDGERRP